MEMKKMDKVTTMMVTPISSTEAQPETKPMAKSSMMKKKQKLKSKEMLEKEVTESDGHMTVLLF